MATVTRHHDEPGCNILTVGNVVVVLWRGPPTVPQLDRLEALIHSNNPGGRTATLNVMVDGVPRFSDEARQRAADISKRAENISAGAASVVLIPGMRGVTIRMFLNTVTMLSRSKRPMRAFDAVEDGAAWLVEQLGTDARVTREELVREVHGAIASTGPAAPA